MPNSDYKINAIRILLNRDCTLQKYYPLIPQKESLIERLKNMGCKTKSDCMKLSDEKLLEAGLSDFEAVRLFRRFLVQYDIKPAKLREIASCAQSDREITAFKDLYQLPGVKSTRAMLYYKAGFCSLRDIARSSPQEIIEKTALAIRKEKLSCIVPLMKEVKTHIAVAKAFTDLITE